MGRTILRKTAVLPDLFVSVWLSFALVLMLPASQWQQLAPSSVDSYDRVATVKAAQGDSPEDGLPKSNTDKPTYQVLQLFEDDVLHEDHVCLAPMLELKVARVVPLEPDSPHTARLERPPLAVV